jgi:hypothetical protein|tara:strand:+ start:52 stop:795 length:744 start_codon:yes stop_codon:yes gene_type:complete
MTVEEMHYEFKLKLNKVDSLDYSNFQIPEIDWYLNEAMNVFMKQKYGIFSSKGVGFETIQKRIDDLRNLVVKEGLTTGLSQTDSNTFEASLPGDYIFLVRAKATASKKGCKKKELTCVQVQHDDLNGILEDPYYSPSYEWGELPLVFGTTGTAATDLDKVFVYTDGSFTVQLLNVDYLRRPKRISFPIGTPNSQYNYPDGTTVIANQDCELAEHTHKEIVDLAVQIVAGDIDHPGYQIKALKNTINE